MHAGTFPNITTTIQVEDFATSCCSWMRKIEHNLLDLYVVGEYHGQGAAFWGQAALQHDGS